MRSGKGNKDRTTVLPQAVIEPLKAYLQGVKKLHEQYLAKGLGEVYLPEGLDKKYPNASKEWRWQYA